ncbi:MAG TPA: GAF domain-containing protein, partial [bacterium]|nr:GAF domain-containing protein [bacterium]
MEPPHLPGRGAMSAPKLAILLEIHQGLSRSLNFQESLNVTLQILHSSYRILSGGLLLCDAENKTLHLSAAVGLPAHPARDIYRYNEGLSGRIAETGKPVVVPRVSKEPLFLNRLGSWEGAGRPEQSFFGVPIALDYRTLGVLFINLPYVARRDYDSTLNFLTLIASALVQRLALRQMTEAEQQKLLTENVILKQQLHQEN